MRTTCDQSDNQLTTQDTPLTPEHQLFYRHKMAAKSGHKSRRHSIAAAIFNGANAIKTRRGGSCSIPIDTAIKQLKLDINFFSFICVSRNVPFDCGHPSSGTFRPHSVTGVGQPFDGRATPRGVFLKIAAHHPPPSVEETKEDRRRPVNVFSINQMELDGIQWMADKQPSLRSRQGPAE